MTALAARRPSTETPRETAKQPRITLLHGLLLLFACLLLFGNYYCYDIPGALTVELREWLDVSQVEWQWELNLLYAAYSLPNLLMPIVGGVMVDFCGTTRMLMLFVVLMCAGQALFCVGLQTKTYWVMAAGRVLFGMGGESLEVAQARVTTDWFRRHSLGLALGLNLTCARLATALNDILSPRVAASSGPVTASWMGLLVCVLSGLCGAAMCYVNRRGATRRLSTSQSSTLSPAETLVGGADDSSCSLSRPSSRSESVLEEERVGLLASGQSDTSGDSDNSSLTASPELIRWHHIFRLPASFWVLCLATVALYGAVNPFIHILSDFLQTKWKYSPQEAGALMALPDIVSAVGSPLGGFVLDRLANRPNNQHIRALFLPLSGAILVVVHLLMGFTVVDPVLPLCLLGVSYSVFGAALWPLVPQLVHNEALLGTAYGVCTVALNLTLTVVPLIVARITSMSAEGSYEWAQVWFVGMAAVGIFLSIAVGVMERRSTVYDGLPVSSESNCTND